MKDIKKWLLDGAKTAFRYFIIGAAPIAIEAGIQYIQILTLGIPTFGLSPAAVWGIRLALAAADKTLHEWKKNIGTEGSWKGIVGI